MPRTASLILLLVAVMVLSDLFPSMAAQPLEEGMAMYEAERYADALPLLLRAVKRQPNNGRAWTWLGATYVQLNRLQDAVQALKRAVALDPRSEVAHFFRAVAYARLGEVEKARVAFQRVRALAPASPYAVAAADWLGELASGTRPAPPVPRPSPSPAGVSSCPKPTPLPAASAPPAVKTREAAIEIADWEFSVEKEELVIRAEVDNLSDRDVRNVRLQALGFGLNGRQVASAVTAPVATLRSDDTASFTLKLGTRPPVFWVQVQIMDYTGRRADERLHAILAPVEPQEYQALARTRIRIAVTILPAEVARTHRLCLRIGDGGGFPIQAVRVRVALTGTAPRLSIQQQASAEVTAEGRAVQVEWNRPVSVTAQVEVESVRLAPLPPIKSAD